MVPGLTNVLAISAGGRHALALLRGGHVVAWGEASAPALAVPPNPTGIVAVAAGEAHSLALRSDGTVIAWGDNISVQINVPPGLSNVVAIAAGRNSLALQSDGTIVEWGCCFGRSPLMFRAVAVCAGTYNLALGEDAPPVVMADEFLLFPGNTEIILQLSASDPTRKRLVPERRGTPCGAIASDREQVFDFIGQPVQGPSIFTRRQFLIRSFGLFERADSSVRVMTQRNVGSYFFKRPT